MGSKRLTITASPFGISECASVCANAARPATTIPGSRTGSICRTAGLYSET